MPPDEFQDYDFSYFVTDMDHFKKNNDWLKLQSGKKVAYFSSQR
ncbi:aminoglycoside 6-adenylyltransferase [Paenibacillus chitinolyticus]|uniref:Aminoglycoside 6-adenylyltransferase n=1 Tax=Paenibacillus chitinolyticus TaxID=79263 RepID=A0ABT4FLX7_9BACL|nr:aminoglycoside 6-adenylyltransferase [Paenibacillus chitinolyticus]MCY9598024.1 aminoglycoside 6-adenylyltransferase [Paenibacillus chitinolyticus]